MQCKADKLSEENKSKSMNKIRIPKDSKRENERVRKREGATTIEQTFNLSIFSFYLAIFQHFPLTTKVIIFASKQLAQQAGK